MQDLISRHQSYGLKEIIDPDGAKCVLSIHLPIKVKSANDTSHWRQSAALVKKHAWMIKALMKDIELPALPVHITFVRIAPRKFDDDNLMIAFKGIRDTIAQLYYPDTRRGMADSKDCFTWEYRQEQGKPKQYSIRILLSRL